MKRIFKLSVVLAALALLAGLMFNPVTSNATDEGPECLTIDTNGKKKKVENFPHRLHQKKYVKDKGCKHCHHQGAGTACRNCHGKKKKVDGKVAPTMKKAAHKLCKGCHKGKKATHDGSSAKGKKLDKCKTCHDAKRDCMTE